MRIQKSNIYLCIPENCPERRLWASKQSILPSHTKYCCEDFLSLFFFFPFIFLYFVVRITLHLHLTVFERGSLRVQYINSSVQQSPVYKFPVLVGSHSTKYMYIYLVLLWVIGPDNDYWDGSKDHEKPPMTAEKNHKTQLSPTFL